jgi:hypothetical protein
MIKRSRLDDVKIVVCHRNPDSACPDGTASAVLLRDVFPDAKILFASHLDVKKIAPPQDKMLFCDVCPRAEDIEGYLAAGAIVLDHHKTDKDTVLRFAAAERGVFGDETLERGVSGAVLAFRYAWFPMAHPEAAPGDAARVDLFDSEDRNAFEFARLAGIRDTWVRESPDWDVACALAEGLRFWPLERIPATPFAGRLDIGLAPIFGAGEILVDRAHRKAQGDIARGRIIARGGFTFLIVPTIETSDLADIVADEVDLVVGFSHAWDPATDASSTQLSLRSRGRPGRDRFDCAAFAKHYGGGGHTGAAGCRVSNIRDPFGAIDKLVSDWSVMGVHA